LLKIVKGQRYISEMEPELGIGEVLNVEARRLQIRFDESSVERQYTLAAAPLIRVRFKSGDTVISKDGSRFVVDSVEEENGLLFYLGENNRLSETDLSGIISFSTPTDRLTNCFVDDNKTFNLRFKSLSLKSDINVSPVRGFVGGRVELIPHQFYIASEVSSRFIPRVLLSDDTGLGKTIEACLVLHRLIHSERINRVLIVVPESLVHQWFFELYRRFNLVFRIFDEVHCREFELSQNDENPFQDDQLGICSLDFYLTSEKRRDQIIASKWDMLVIDEAHHLDDSPGSFALIEPLCKTTEGLMLLTATPEQAGLTSHFNNLKLIDPDRYHDFENFKKQGDEYRQTAERIDDLLDGKEEGLSSAWRDKKNLKKIEEILDCHGPGRIIFRNTRAVIADFPERKGLLHPLSGNEKDVKTVNTEVAADIHRTATSDPIDYSQDLRINWLTEFLSENRDSKVLLICRTVEKAVAVEAAIKLRVNLKIARFHEQMNLLQRDRSAAWFSKKDGAQVLICSEIGSEGRNFQFANHLVMFDLPVNPELLEQRIGRLDRIGQKKTIYIHVPYVAGSAQEILAKWYDSGLNGFEENISGVHQIYKEYKDKLKGFIDDAVKTTCVDKDRLGTFIHETEKSKKTLLDQVVKGRDRLLELNSFKPHHAATLIQQIKALDKSDKLADFMAQMFDHYKITQDDIDRRTFKLFFNDGLEKQFSVPTLKKNGMVATFDRNTAVTREDIEFLTQDHPMVRGSIDLFLGTVQGNSSIAVLKNTGAFGLLLESIYVLECIAPGKLNIGRFLPSVPIRIVVNHAGEDVTEKYPVSLFETALENLSPNWLKENPQIRQKLLPGIAEAGLKYACHVSETYISNGLKRVSDITGREHDRLIMLKKINHSIRDEEIRSAKQKMDQLNGFISAARLRLDAVRLIRCDE